jgi:hypothetical protein
MKFIKFMLLLFLLTCLPACSPYVGREQPALELSSLVVQEHQTLGQTFVAVNDGLDGIELHLDPEIILNGDLILHLRSDPDTKEDLTTSKIPLESISSAGSYRFQFDPQKDSRQRYYYIFLEITGQNVVKVGSASANAYLDGSMYSNHEPIDLQMTFHLLYDPGLSALSFIKEILRWCGIFLIGIFLFVIPGLALLKLLFPAQDSLSFPTRVTLGIGVSLAIYPVMVLWADILGLHLGSFYAWVPSLLGIVVLLWKGSIKRNQKITIVKIKNWLHSENRLPDLVFSVIVCIIIFFRFLPIRLIDLPMWGDSYHHSLIAQLIVENNGLFNSWQPYADLTTLTYHFGFHTHVAIFHWITGVPIYRACLWTGQIINVLAILSLYPLALKIGKKPWAGIICVLIAGLLSPMPNEYLNWGRYPQLAGQAILPSMIFLLWELRKSEKTAWSNILLIGLTSAGLALTHFRVLIFMVLFALILFIKSALFKRSFYFYAQFSLGAIAGTLLFLPWFLRLHEGRILGNLTRQLATPASIATEWMRNYNAIGDLSTYLPIYIWSLLLIGLVIALVYRRKETLLFTGWWILILLAANPNRIGLPGQGALSNFAVFIAMYIPAAILIGVAIGWLLHRWPKLEKYMVVITLIAGILGGISRFQEIDVRTHALASRPDIQAANWIKDNTDPDAKFLVNSFFAYGNALIVGSDGGWWLPLLSQRKTTLPPITYGVEQGPITDYRQWINSLEEEIQAKGLGNEDTLDVLQARGITHIYIGQQQGRVNYSGSLSFDPATLKEHPNFLPVYNRDRVWIFEVLR